MKKYLLLLILTLALIACGKPKEKEESKISKKSVKTEVVKKELISAEIGGNGNFTPVNEATHTVPEADVVKVYYKNGDRVKKGAVVIQLEDINIKATYETAKANLMTAESNYNKSRNFSEAQEKNQYEGAKAAMINAKETMDKAKRGAKLEEIDIAKLEVGTAKKNYEQSKFNYDKNKKLFDEKLISASAFLDVETAYVRSKSNLEKAEKNLAILEAGADKEDLRKLEAAYNQSKSNYELSQKNIKEKIWDNSIVSAESNYLIAKANFDLAKQKYEDLTVRAKIDGIVSGLEIKEYAKTAKEKSLFYIIDDNEMEVSIGLNAPEIIQISKDSKVVILTEELGKTFEGKVSEISPAADAKTNKFMVKVKIENKESVIKKGMYTKVTIFAKEKEMLVVPKNAVVIKNLYKYVFKIVDGVAKQIKIEIGNSTDSLQEILTDEIKIGDKIVIDGQYLLQENDLIEEVK